ncbi:MAG TPA: hypothetical protein VNA30_01735 [Mycobacteriales bacterium]|nr:hypothetical protein [Mycobacteriales bacterium]
MAPAPFAVGPQEVRFFGTASTNEDLVFVSNGQSLQRSGDGGCTWSATLTPGPLVAPEAATVTIESITFTPRPELPDAIFVLGHERLPSAEQIVRPRVWVSRDAGKSFERAETGLPPVGHALRLQGLQLPGAAVLGVEGASGAGTGVQFFSTSDSGQTWVATPRKGLGAENNPVRGPTLRGFVVHPTQPLRIWGWDATAVYYSVDGGGGFTPIRSIGAPVTTMDISPSPLIPGRSRVRGFHEGGRSQFSDDDGQTWTAEPEPARRITAVASIPFVAGLYATAAADGAVTVRESRGQRRDLTPRAPGAKVDRLSFTFTANPLLYVGDGKVLLRRRLFGLKTSITVVRDSVGVLQAPPALRLGKPSLSPAHSTLRVRPGGHVDVAYSLALPPVPTPLDIMFVTDTTPSMQPVIDALRAELAGVINDLAGLGISSRFGLADFREYPAFGHAAGNYPYRRLRPVSAVDERLRTALDSLTTGGGVVGNHTSGLEALFQAATGAGRTEAASGDRIEHIPPGQGADFRPNAVKVIVMATESHWREATTGYPGPTRAATFSALTKAGIHVVGLATGENIDRGPSSGDAGGPGPPLRAAAKATDTFAPEEGIDCDSDGIIDVRAGEPLVCQLSGTPRLGPAMSALLAAVVDLATVRFDVEGKGVTARALTTQVFPTVDVKRSNQLRLTVRYSCAASAGERRGTATVSVRVRDETLDQARADIACLADPPPPVPADPPVELVAPVAAVAIAPPPPPVAQVPITNPQPNPNPNVNPNVGVAANRQQQLQLQVATQELRPDAEDQLAFSALPLQQSTPWAPVLALSGLFFTAACAYGVRLAHATARA